MREFQSKLEVNDTKFSKSTTTTTTTSRQWAGFKNPRIVRVSRAFGGKDRHSKVFTIRGLRDRRIRLSVPTAIQLYDLQHKLGLSQPSKVVDWLLDETKHEIDKLPPLQLPPGNPNIFPPNHAHDHQTSQSQFLSHNLIPGLNRDPKSMGKSKEVVKDGDFDVQNFFPVANQSSFNPYYYHLEPSNLSLSQFGGSHGFSPLQIDQDTHNHSLSQFYFYPQPTTPSLLAPTLPLGESDPRAQINRLQFLSSNSQTMGSNPLFTPLHLVSPAMKPFGFGFNNPKAPTDKGDDGS